MLYASAIAVTYTETAEHDQNITPQSFADQCTTGIVIERQ